jgi:hypothetical protein
MGTPSLGDTEKKWSGKSSAGWGARILQPLYLSPLLGALLLFTFSTHAFARWAVVLRRFAAEDG